MKNKKIAQEKAVAIRQESTQLARIDVKNIDQIEEAEEAPIDLMSDYWTPETMGESKRMIFDRIDVSRVLSQEDGEVFELECAFFFVKENGRVRQIRNGSKRLVGALQAYNIERGTPLMVRYLGKKRNKSNQFSSDNWSVTPLIIKAK